MSDPLPFAEGSEVNDYRWTCDAYDLLREGKLVVGRRKPGRLIVATGACPRCTHDVDYSFLPTISLPRGDTTTLGKGKSSKEPKSHGSESEDGSDQYDTVPIVCRCRHDHPGRLPGDRGCGIVFNAEVVSE